MVKRRSLSADTPNQNPEDSVAGPLVSIIVPLFNEESNAGMLVKRLDHELRAEAVSYEIILVDDGSKDGTWEAIKTAASSNHNVKGISFSRNFGYQKALLGGFSHARGEAIISMDGDLQHPPELVGEMIRRWRQGFKIVETNRTDSPDTPAHRRFASTWFYRVFSFLCGMKITRGSSDFRLIDRSVMNILLGMKDSEQFLRGAVRWIGFDLATVDYQAGDRLSGRSKFNLKSLFTLSARALVSFSSTPLRIGIWLGLFTSFLAFVELVYIFVRHFQGATVPGWASTLTVISFMFGILFILLGLIGAYLGLIFDVIKNRPAFIIRESTSPNPHSSEKSENELS